MAIEFTESDLKENQKGRLSDAQARTLRNDSIRIAAIICACLMIVSVLGVLSAGNVTGGDLQFVGLIAFTILAGTFWFYVGRTDAAIRASQVQALSGEAQVTISVNGIIFINIGDHRFRLTITEAKAFESGTAYTLYVIPRLNRIVSFEVYSRTEQPANRKIERTEVIIAPISDEEHEILRA